MISLTSIVKWDEENFWKGLHKRIARWQTREKVLRRSSVVASYKRVGDSSRLVLPRMNRCQIEGMLFLCRYLLEYSEDPELTLFAMGCIEALKDMILKKFQLDKTEPDEHIEDFLYDIQIYFDFNGNGYKSRISDQYCYYAKDEKSGKIQGPQNNFFGNVLEPALRQFDQISVETEKKGEKAPTPQRLQRQRLYETTSPLETNQRLQFGRRPVFFLSSPSRIGARVSLTFRTIWS